MEISSTYRGKTVYRLVLFTRIFLGFVFLGGGMSKLIHGFPGLMGPVWLEESLSAYGLGTYARFIAYSQAVAGLLLLTGRYALLGAVIVFPIILNILMVTISLEWRGTPYVVSVFLVMNIFLLFIDFDALKIFLNRNDSVRFYTTPEIYPVSYEILWWTGFLVTITSPNFVHLNNSLALGVAIFGISSMFFIQGFHRWKSKRSQDIF